MCEDSVLKPIKWAEYDDVPEMLCEAVTPICEYTIYNPQDESGIAVSYYNRQTEEPTKEAYGFNDVEQAKRWCWRNYNNHMKRWLK